MRYRTATSVICCALLLSSSSWAATLEPGQGNLLVNQGQGFQSVNGRIDTNVGDSVMVGAGGSATLVYSDGCKVNVQPGSVATVAPLSPCASGSNADANSDNYWVVGGVVLGAAALGVGIAALSRHNTTTVVQQGTCGTAANPCYTKVSP